MAKHVSRDPEGEAATPGGPGGYQLQVSSFKTQNEADSFAAVLRRRGHKAYVEPANVKGRGLWYRVRVGPFKYRHSAVIYRQEFEAKERMVTFIVDPPKPGAKGSGVVVRASDDDE
jgi:cell division septation protein DedD